MITIPTAALKCARFTSFQMLMVKHITRVLDELNVIRIENSVMDLIITIAPAERMEMHQ